MSGDVKVPSGSTVTLGFVDGDLSVGRDATVKGEGAPPNVKVTGTIECRGNCVFKCDVAAEDFEGEHGDVLVQGNLDVKGDVEIQRGRLNVEGKLGANDVEVERSLVVGKDLEAKDVDVSGSIEVEGGTRVKTISVGGSFRGMGEIEAEDVEVGGSVVVESRAEIERLDVGGTVTLHGGHVGEIDVGGSFVSKDSLEFGSIDVGGTVKLIGENKGGDIDVGGSCRVDGSIRFRNIDVGGVILISELAEGESLDVGGKAQMEASMRLSGKLDAGGSVEVKDALVAKAIDVGGSLKAHQITAKYKVSVGDSIATAVGIDALYFEIGRQGRVSGPIHAKEAVVRERAHVEDVYADNIIMEKKAQAKNLYGQRIRIRTGCKIEGEVNFTQSLESEKEVFFKKNPVKVEKLP